ncbi:MAG: hypothetical protein V1720_03590 [bacterium]
MKSKQKENKIKGIPLIQYTSSSPYASNFTIYYLPFKDVNTKHFPEGLKFNPWEVSKDSSFESIPTIMFENIGNKVRVYILGDPDFISIIEDEGIFEKALGLKVHILNKTNQYSPKFLIYFEMFDTPTLHNYAYSIEMKHDTLHEVLKKAYSFDADINKSILEQLPKCTTDYTALLDKSTFPLKSIIIPSAQTNKYWEAYSDGRVKCYELINNL